MRLDRKTIWSLPEWKENSRNEENISPFESPPKQAVKKPQTHNFQGSLFSYLSYQFHGRPPSTKSGFLFSFLIALAARWLHDESLRWNWIWHGEPSSWKRFMIILICNFKSLYAVTWFHPRLQPKNLMMASNTKFISSANPLNVSSINHMLKLFSVFFCFFEQVPLIVTLELPRLIIESLLFFVSISVFALCIASSVYN